MGDFAGSASFLDGGSGSCKQPDTINPIITFPLIRFKSGRVFLFETMDLGAGAFILNASYRWLYRQIHRFRGDRVLLGLWRSLREGRH